MRDEVYAIEENGTGTLKRCVQKSARPLLFSIEEHSCEKKNVPWTSDINGIGLIVEEIDKQMYDTFGKTWIFDPDGGSPTLIKDIVQSLK